MNDAFDFLFSFYGLLLGLAIAELAGGFSRAWDHRKSSRIGVLAPLFALVLLLDLITFWVGAWAYRDLSEVTFELALAAAAVALLYYFASTLVFPKQGDLDSLDTHILQHRRTVIGCVIISNLIHVLPQWLQALLAGAPTDMLVFWAGLNALYYALLLTAGLARDRRVTIGALVATIMLIVGATSILQ